LKTLEDREKSNLPPEQYPDFCCLEWVNVTHFIHSGPVLRVLSNVMHGLPMEIVTIRLHFLHDDSIPRFLYLNRATLRGWAFKRLVESLRLNNFNVLDNPRITLDHFTSKFTVSSLTPEMRDTLGSHEAGLWVCNYPGFIAKRQGKLYADGSEEAVHIINLHLNLVPVHLRLHVPEGGFNPPSPITVEPPRRSDSPAEKRARSSNLQRPANLQPSPRERERENSDATRMLRDEVSQMRQAIKELKSISSEPYPKLPPSQVHPGGATPWFDPDNDVPKFV
jgi:hypothetical protein